MAGWSTPPPIRGDRGGSLRSPPEIRRPIRFPCLATIGGKSLFPVSGGRGDMRPEEPHADGFSPERIVGIEGADAVLETAPDRRVEVAGRIAPVEPPDRPVPGLRIVRAQRD